MSERASPSLGPKLKLHIGCGDQRIPGYVNCDLYKTAATDMTFDCQGSWPFPDDSVEEIYTSHVLEHLEYYEFFFREAHRVLKPTGNLQIRVPYAGHRLAFIDPTHVRYWYAESFSFLQPGYAEAVHNAQHGERRAYFSIEDSICRVIPRLAPYLRWRWLRRRILPKLRYFHDVVEELWVYLVPLKTDKQIMAFKQMRRGDSVCSRYSMYEHEVEGRELGQHEACRFVDWREDHDYDA